MPGVFEVYLNDEVLYTSLHHQGKLPAAEAIINALKKRLPGQ